jgi:dienelactone hydrolase
MVEVVLFHHALGLTAGSLAFAEELRAAGHVVHVLDLYDGKTFTDLKAGVGYAQHVGFGTIMERARGAVEGLAKEIVYVGLSLGVMPAQMLAQTRAGAKGAVLLYSCAPPEEFGGAWPEGVPVQMHMMEEDKWVVEGGDLAAARELAETVEGATLFLYPGDRHLFADSGLADYDQGAAALLKERVLGFLNTVG